MEENVKKRTIKNELFSWVVFLGATVVITYLIITFVGIRTQVEGASMEDSLHDGDNLIVEKVTYGIGNPSRFDIIVFPYKYESNTFYIKRIIGLPGETVQVKNGEVYIDGELLDEDYGKELMDNAGMASEPITLGEGEYFVLGDNRNHSADSRDPSVGLIKEDDIVGKAFLRVWPLADFGLVNHE